MIQWFGFIDVTNSAPKAPQKVLKRPKKCQNYFPTSHQLVVGTKQAFSNSVVLIKFGHSEKDTKFEKIFHLNLTLLSSVKFLWKGTFTYDVRFLGR